MPVVDKVIGLNLYAVKEQGGYSCERENAAMFGKRLNTDGRPYINQPAGPTNKNYVPVSTSGNRRVVPITWEKNLYFSLF
ncbi:hypothetical protein E6O75_ATG10183 [Venturia nashicola]|uniref:Uncharacterized protein n=1 Tax=Venturia nashicola TaxID=86259 RepID=A0A4Z1NRU6_9PEZI|nr:hypothetical protein E6O75_ATG10183 [Venturia nashicola]